MEHVGDIVKKILTRLPSATLDNKTGNCLKCGGSTLSHIGPRRGVTIDCEALKKLDEVQTKILILHTTKKDEI